jgi:hypothetical protein
MMGVDDPVKMLLEKILKNNSQAPLNNYFRNSVKSTQQLPRAFVSLLPNIKNRRTEVGKRSE